MLANENKPKNPWKAFHVTIMETEGASKGTPKVGKLANKTIIAERGKVKSFGWKSDVCMKLLARWIIKAGSRHPFLKVFSLDFFSYSYIFSMVLAEEWIFFIFHPAYLRIWTVLSGICRVFPPSWEAVAKEETMYSPSVHSFRED